MSERLVFSASFESVFRALGPQLTQKVLPQVAALGVDPSKLEPAYPLATWTALVRAAAPVLSPDVALEVALYRLGERVVDAYGEGFVGKTLFTVLRMMGPRRALERTTRNFRTTNNYSESTVKEDPPGVFTIWINEMAAPELTQGVLAAGVRQAGAREVRVEITSKDATGSTFRVSWSA